MEPILKQQSYTEMVSVWQGRETRDFSTDCIVPDVMPDAGQIVEANGILSLRSRDTRDGAIFLNAAADISVLYTTEEGDRILSLGTSIPVEFPLNAPGSNGDCRTTMRMELSAVEARAVNSRKLVVRIVVTVYAACWAVEEKTIFCAAEVIPEGTKLLNGHTETQRVSDIREKTYVVTDEFLLPTGKKPAAHILSRQIRPVVKDVKVVGGKAIFRGYVQTTLLCASEDGTEILSGRYESDFSQILEVECPESEAVSEVFVTLTGAYFDVSDSRTETAKVNAEFHFAAQVLCRSTTELTYVSDLYSNRTMLLPQSAEIHAVGSVVPIHMHKPVSGVCEPYFTGGEVLFADAVIASVTAEKNMVRADVAMHVITRDDNGRFAASKCRTQVSFEPEIPVSSRIEHIVVSVGEVHYGMGERGTEIRAEVSMDANILSDCCFSCVESVEENEELWNEQKDTFASITLVRPEAPADLWSLAKRYHSDREVLQHLNGEKTEGLFLVPRTR